MARKIKVVMVPFSYPAYSEEVINKYVKESTKAVSDLDMQVVTTNVVRKAGDVKEVVASCEDDVPLVISQLLLHYISEKVTGYGDIHDMLSDNSVLFAACGFAPLSFAVGKPQIGKHTAQYEGLLNSSVYKEGEVTLCRLASDGDGYKMHITSGEAVVPPPFREIDCPPYPLTKIVLSDPAEQFMQQLMSQHYAIVYGNFKEELLRFCRLLQIRPVVPGQ